MAMVTKVFVKVTNKGYKKRLQKKEPKGSLNYLLYLDCFSRLLIVLALGVIVGSL